MKDNEPVYLFTRISTPATFGQIKMSQFFWTSQETRAQENELKHRQSEQT